MFSVSKKLMLYYVSRKKLIEDRMKKIISLTTKSDHIFKETEAYDMIMYGIHGGKKLRGVLTLLTCEALGGNLDKALDAAAAVGFVHNASLIHDNIIDGDEERRGLAKVLNGALEASSIIESEMLVFGEKAKANSAPMLEIETYNVEEARHATSISRLSEDHIFYLASRGINVKEAEKLIIKAASERFLEKIEMPTKEFLGKLIYEKLTIEKR